MPYIYQRRCGFSASQSQKSGCGFYIHFSPSEGGVADAPVILSERSVAHVLFSLIKFGMPYVPVDPSEGGVAYVQYLSFLMKEAWPVYLSA